MRDLRLTLFTYEMASFMKKYINIYAFYYFLLIILFAIFYRYTLPKYSFYIPTLNSSETIINLKRTTELKIKEEIVSLFIKSQNTDKYIDGFYQGIRTISVSNLRCNVKDISKCSFDVLVRVPMNKIDPYKKNTFSTRSFTTTIQIPNFNVLNRFNKNHDQKKDSPPRTQVETFNHLNKQQSKKANLDYWDVQGVLPRVDYGNLSLIQFGYNINYDIHNYLYALEGLSSEKALSFLDYLYFSIVTITTLGYGDMTPITNYSRFLVGLESILGIIVIGLFLNSLSKKSE
jgi:hypothetical protein